MEAGLVEFYPFLLFFQPLAEHDEDEAQSVKEFFLKSLQEYGEKVVSLNDRKSINAMKAMTRTLKKSMKCNPKFLIPSSSSFTHLGRGVQLPENRNGAELSTPTHLQ